MPEREGVRPPHSNTGVRFLEVIEKPHNSKNRFQPPELAKFDWYQATFHDTEIDVLTSFMRARYEASDFRTATPKNGYERAAEITRGDRVLMRFNWGGNSGINVMATGDASPEAARYIQSFGSHRVTRADSCIDYSEAGLFDRISGLLTGYAIAKNLKINQQGDWERGKARTLYLGSRSSAVQLVIYEKGYESGADDLDWVRLEVRVKPKGKRGYTLANCLPSELFGTSWVAQAVELCGLPRYAQLNLGTVYRPSDTERSRLALCRQYGAILKEWIDTSKDSDLFVHQILSTIEETQKQPHNGQVPLGDLAQLLEPQSCDCAN